MNIFKSLHAGILHKTSVLREKPVFIVSLLWGFSLDSGEAVLEKDIWPAIGEALGKDEMFDAGMPKPAGEVLVHGSFFSPTGEPTTGGRVAVSLGQVKKELSVFGDRYWKTGGMGMTDPVPMTQMPVDYGHAFGGPEDKNNPVGKGVAPETDKEGKKHPLPNIEYPDRLIASGRDRPAPAAFSRVGVMSRQRLSRAGTYDSAYIRERIPHYPKDMDRTFFHDAAPDQWIEDFWQGTEPYRIVHMNPDQPVISGQLPGIRGRCFINREVDGEIVFKEIDTHLDTVCFFPHKNLGVLIHRGGVTVSDDDGADIKQLLPAHENLADPPRPHEHYQTEMTRRADPEEGFKYIMYTAPLIPEGCRCGFELVQEEEDFPLEFLQRDNMLNFAENQRQAADEKLQKQKNQALESMQTADPGMDGQEFLDNLSMDGISHEASPEERKINELMENILPGVTTDPDNIDLTGLNLKGFDDLKAYTEQVQEEKQAEALKQLESELERLKDLEDAAPGKEEAIRQVEQLIVDRKVGPVLPRFDFESRMDTIRQQMYEAEKQQLLVLQSTGADREQLEKAGIKNMVDLEELEQQLESAQEKAQKSYKDGAHYIENGRSPHEGQEKILAENLLTAFKEGRSAAGGDYAFVDLSGCNLSGIDLSGAFLEYADLSGADLSKANLSGAVLAHANLNGTDFFESNLSGANLGAAKIHNTRFENSDLTGAVLGKADIQAARFHDCRLTDRMEMFLETSFQQVDFSGSVMKNTNFIEISLAGCTFRGADLSDSNFINTDITSAVFDEAVLTGVNFVKTEGYGSSFRRASMKNARFVGGCSLPDASFSSALAVQANFMDCNLRQADFSGADVSQSNFGNSDMSNASLVKATAAMAQFNSTNLDRAVLHRANLMEGSLYKARLTGTDLKEANLYGANFMGAVLGETDFTGANLKQTILKNWNP
ncbi:MAG: DUF2169 domain-containing protein [Desulfobacteraceae bacterium]